MAFDDSTTFNFFVFVVFAFFHVLFLFTSFRYWIVLFAKKTFLLPISSIALFSFCAWWCSSHFFSLLYPLFPLYDFYWTLLMVARCQCSVSYMYVARTTKKKSSTYSQNSITAIVQQWRHTERNLINTANVRFNFQGILFIFVLSIYSQSHKYRLEAIVLQTTIFLFSFCYFIGVCRAFFSQLLMFVFGFSCFSHFRLS